MPKEIDDSKLRENGLTDFGKLYQKLSPAERAASLRMVGQMQKEGLLQNQEPEESPKNQEDRGVSMSLPKGTTVARSSDGRVGVLAAGLPAMMLSPDGTWSEDVFDATEMMEDCVALEDTEAAAVFAEAKKVFESNPSRFKSLKPKIQYPPAECKIHLPGPKIIICPKCGERIEVG